MLATGDSILVGEIINGGSVSVSPWMTPSPLDDGNALDPSIYNIISVADPGFLEGEGVKKVHVGKDQEKVQSEKDSKNRGGKKTKPTIRY